MTRLSLAYALVMLGSLLPGGPPAAAMIEAEACMIEHDLLGRSTSARAIANLRLKTAGLGRFQPHGFVPVAYGKGRHDIYLETRLAKPVASLDDCRGLHRRCLPSLFDSTTVSLYCVQLDGDGNPKQLHVVREPS